MLFVISSLLFAFSLPLYPFIPFIPLSLVPLSLSLVTVLFQIRNPCILNS